MKRKLTKLEAFKLRKNIAESTKKQVRVVRKEDFEEGEVYAAIDMGDGATVTFDDGSLFVGPFASEEEAKAAVGDDVMLVSGDVDSEAGMEQPVEGDDELEGLVKESVATVDSAVFQNIMGMSPEEAVEEYQVNTDRFAELSSALDSGKWVYGGSPEVYYKGMSQVFDGALTTFASAGERDAYLLTSVAENGDLEITDSLNSITSAQDYDMQHLSKITESKTQNSQKKGSTMKSNMLRINKRVVESIRQRVKADIMRESEALDSLDTDADKTDQSTEDGAGAHDFKGVASFVNAEDTGPNELDSLESDQDPAADSSEDNMLETASYVRLESLVNVLDTKTGKKVDTGIVESVSKKGEVKVNGEVYTTAGFKFVQLA